MAKAASGYSFTIGTGFAYGFALLRQHWRKLVWLYIVFMLMPGVILGELGDEPTDPLYRLFSDIRYAIEPELTVFGYAYQICVALFSAFALAAVLDPDQKPWAGGLRALFTILLLNLLPFVLAFLAQKLMQQAVFLTLIYIIHFSSLFLQLVFSLLFFVAPAHAVKRFNPASALARSLSIVWPFVLRVLVFVLVLGVLSAASQFAEQWLLLSYQTPDGTAFDWFTTVVQELIRSGHLIVWVVLVAGVYQLLVRAKSGPPPAETASVFD